MPEGGNGDAGGDTQLGRGIGCSRHGDPDVAINSGRIEEL